MTPISRQLLPSACAAGLCAVLFVAYAEHIAPRLLPGGTTGIVAAVLVLVILGFLAGFAAYGNLGVKLAFLAIVPIGHWLYAGSDPAKPNMALMVGGIEMVSLWFAAILGHYIQQRRSPAPTSSG